MQMEVLIIDNGILTYPANKPYLWNGLFSVAKTNGSIIQYIHNCLKSYANILFILPLRDGNVRKTQIEPYIQQAKDENKILIVGTLGQVDEDPGINYMYIPLDDDFFENGTSAYFRPETLMSWDDRLPIAYWRGGCSGPCSTDCAGGCSRDCTGGGINSLRVRTTKELLHYEHADVKMTYYWRENKNIPDEYFGDRVDYSELFKYKIFLIIDGNVIASNHMWGFASGSVPFIISNAKCWFTPLLEPFVNYIPVAYDLSDLKEKIEWVVNNDDKAKIIMQNAIQFANTVFSPEYQQKYIESYASATYSI